MLFGPPGGNGTLDQDLSFGDGPSRCKVKLEMVFPSGFRANYPVVGKDNWPQKDEHTREQMKLKLQKIED
eukprot:15358602-Ditylum_brightwellii.AAC.1